VAGCGDYGNANRSATNEAGIIREFAQGPDAATDKYRERLSDGVVSAENMVIASELMEADPVRYDSYYRYVLRGLDSRDDRVVSAAIRALRNSKGPESVHLLFRLYGSGHSQHSRIAADSIRYRYVTASHAADGGDEASGIESEASRVGLRL
jgi:hypothetical protein